MRKIIILLILLLLSSTLFSQVNGVIENINGKRVLFIWGTHEERGYAHGYLEGSRIKNIFDSYMVSFMCGNSPVNYNLIRSFYLTIFS